MRFVLDASVALSWCLDGQASSETDDILRGLSSGDEAEVPFIWALEMVNVLLNAERRRSLTAAGAGGFLGRLDAYPIRIDREALGKCFDRIVTIARETRLSAYDACYLELAQREALPLATLDRGLRRAAIEAGVRLIPVG